MLLPASTFSVRPVSHPPGRKHAITLTHGRIKLMGLTYVRASVINPADPKKKLRLRFLVDSGAVYSVVPESHLRKLGITPRGSKTFTLADGTEISRKYGHAVFAVEEDRKSTRLNSSHGYISYAVFCLKKKKKRKRNEDEQ